MFILGRAVPSSGRLGLDCDGPFSETVNVQELNPLGILRVLDARLRCSCGALDQWHERGSPERTEAYIPLSVESEEEFPTLGEIQHGVVMSITLFTRAINLQCGKCKKSIKNQSVSVGPDVILTVCEKMGAIWDEPPPEFVN